MTQDTETASREDLEDRFFEIGDTFGYQPVDDSIPEATVIVLKEFYVSETMEAADVELNDDGTILGGDLNRWIEYLLEKGFIENATSVH
jgi:trans-2-enoyl-CoA reductase